MRFRIVAALWIVIWIGIAAVTFVTLAIVGLLTIAVTLLGAFGVLAALSYPLSRWDKRTKKHSEELARLFDTPDIFVGGNSRTTESTTPGLFGQARSHLRAYPKIDPLIKDYESEAVTAKKADSEFDTYLWQAVRDKLRVLYPGAVEWDGTGEWPVEFVRPEQVVQGIKQDFAEFTTSGKRLGLKVTGSGPESQWLVSRSGMIYAGVKGSANAKESELQAFIDKMVEGSDLRPLYAAVQEANGPAWDSRVEAEAEIRKLAFKIRHGHRIYGACDLGY